MIRIGFLLNIPFEYKGGINYLRNLFLAINKFYSEEIEIILFVPADISVENSMIFNQFSRLIKTRLLQKGTFLNLLSRFSFRVFKYDLITEFLLFFYGIKVISHSFYIPIFSKIKAINWIPDFQYLHYPNLYSKKQIQYERKLWKNITTKSDRIILSSYTALNDFNSIFSNFVEKVVVLQFLAQPTIKNRRLDWKNKYTDKPYFYLPNQFWEHKNHIVVWKAINNVVKSNKDIVLLVSGHMKDFRNDNNYLENLISFLKNNQLSDNIILLGVIPYEDVLNLINNCIAVINPSFFEGWSSTVEEARLFNKKIILSDIPVHREQNPNNSFYFDPNSHHELSYILSNILNAESEKSHNDDFNYKEILHNERTKIFADKYISTVKEIIY